MMEMADGTPASTQGATEEIQTASSLDLFLDNEGESITTTGNDHEQQLQPQPQQQSEIDDWMPNWDEAFPEDLATSTTHEAFGCNVFANDGQHAAVATPDNKADNNSKNEPTISSSCQLGDAVAVETSVAKASNVVGKTSIAVVAGVAMDAPPTPPNFSKAGQAKSSSNNGSPRGVDDLISLANTTDNETVAETVAGDTTVAGETIGSKYKDSHQLLQEFDAACTNCDVRTFVKLLNYNNIIDVLDYVITSKGCLPREIQFDCSHFDISAMGCAEHFSGWDESWGENWDRGFGFVNDDDETNEGGGCSMSNGKFSSSLFENEGKVPSNDESSPNNATVYSEDKVRVQEAVRVVKPRREPSANPHYEGRSKLL